MCLLSDDPGRQVHVNLFFQISTQECIVYIKLLMVSIHDRCNCKDAPYGSKSSYRRVGFHVIYPFTLHPVMLFGVGERGKWVDNIQ